MISDVIQHAGYLEKAALIVACTSLVVGVMCLVGLTLQAHRERLKCLIREMLVQSIKRMEKHNKEFNEKYFIQYDEEDDEL